MSSFGGTREIGKPMIFSNDIFRPGQSDFEVGYFRSMLCGCHDSMHYSVKTFSIKPAHIKCICCEKKNIKSVFDS